MIWCLFAFWLIEDERVRFKAVFDDTSARLGNKSECAADEIAVAIGKIGVVARDESVEAEAAVLAEGDFAKQEVAQHIGGEEIAFAFGAVWELLGVDVLAEGFEDGFRADDVALGLRHLGVVEEQPAVCGDGF